MQGTLRRALLPLLAGLLALSLGACQTSRPHSAPDRVEPLGGEGLASLQPADVALAPLIDQTDVDLPTDELRHAFYEALIDRLYSPLELAYVDGHWSESAFSGAAPPDALLVVTILQWDTNQLRAHGIVDGTAELRLYEGGSTSGPLLWAARVHHRVDLGVRPEDHTLVRDLLPEAITAFAKGVVQELPERDATAAQRG